MVGANHGPYLIHCFSFHVDSVATDIIAAKLRFELGGNFVIAVPKPLINNLIGHVFVHRFVKFLPSVGDKALREIARIFSRGSLTCSNVSVTRLTRPGRNQRTTYRRHLTNRILQHLPFLSTLTDH